MKLPIEEPDNRERAIANFKRALKDTAPYRLIERILAWSVAHFVAFVIIAIALALAITALAFYAGSFGRTQAGKSEPQATTFKTIEVDPQPQPVQQPAPVTAPEPVEDAQPVQTPQPSPAPVQAPAPASTAPYPDEATRRAWVKAAGIGEPFEVVDAVMQYTNWNPDAVVKGKRGLCGHLFPMLRVPLGSSPAMQLTECNRYVQATSSWQQIANELAAGTR